MLKTLLFVLGMLTIGSSRAQLNWRLRTEKDGIKIFMAEVPYSKIRAVKVNCSIKTTLSTLVAVVMDVKACPEWVYHTKSCTLLKQVSPSDLYYYSEVNLPWPTENRDFIAHLTVAQNHETKTVTIDGPAVNGMVAEKDGIVRVTDSKGKWVITPAANGFLNVEYTLHVDPGGSVPAWLVNLFAAEGPMQIVKNLMLQVQKPVYQHIKLPYIQDAD